ncbi:MAG: DUF4167 domain-containing protein [Bdellovibrionales bacterium]
MRHGTTNRRQRGRGGNNQQRRGNNQRMQVFDSNGPDVRIRGTAHQVTEKYMALAKDASSSGDIILAESYLQHAEHYQRIINSWGPEESDKPQNQQQKETKAQNQTKRDDDLSLPASILGDAPNVTSQEVLEQVTA